MARKAGRRPKMSGHTSTAAVALAGCTKCASQVPSGVLISTSDSVTSAAAATEGSMAASVAPSPSVLNWRRESSLPRRMSSLESRSHMADPRKKSGGVDSSAACDRRLNGDAPGVRCLVDRKSPRRETRGGLHRDAPMSRATSGGHHPPALLFLHLLERQVRRGRDRDEDGMLFGAREGEPMRTFPR